MAKIQPNPIAVVRYIGGGTYFIGVPARDLTAEEWADLAPDVQEALVAQKLYRVERSGGTEPAAEPAAEPQP